MTMTRYREILRLHALDDPIVNHYLIAQGGGLLVVPEKLVSEFRALLVAHYEGTGSDELAAFMKWSCWKRLGD